MQNEYDDWYIPRIHKECQYSGSPRVSRQHVALVPRRPLLCQDGPPTQQTSPTSQKSMHALEATLQATPSAPTHTNTKNGLDSSRVPYSTFAKGSERSVSTTTNTNPN